MRLVRHRIHDGRGFRAGTNVGRRALLAPNRLSDWASPRMDCRAGNHAWKLGRRRFWNIGGRCCLCRRQGGYGLRRLADWRQCGNRNRRPGDPERTHHGSLATNHQRLYAPCEQIIRNATLRLSVSQPLRVERPGVAQRARWPHEDRGGLFVGAVSADLAPGGRQIDIMAQWHQPLAIGELRFGAVATHQSGHRVAADPELTLLSGWHWTF
jgi:hypothetical protein